MVFWILQLLYIRKKFRDLEIEYDESLTSPSDFTAILYGLPKDTGYTAEQVTEDILAWYRDEPNADKVPLEIDQVVVCY